MLRQWACQVKASRRPGQHHPQAHRTPGLTPRRWPRLNPWLLPLKHNQVHFVAHKHYWGGRPGADRVVARAYASHDTVLAALKDGSLDLAYGAGTLDPGHVSAAQQLPGLTVQTSQPQQTRLVVLNSARWEGAMNLYGLGGGGGKAACVCVMCVWDGGAGVFVRTFVHRGRAVLGSLMAYSMGICTACAAVAAPLTSHPTANAAQPSHSAHLQHAPTTPSPTRRGPTQSLAVRKAITHAVNKAALIQRETAGLEEAAHAVFAPSLPHCIVRGLGLLVAAAGCWVQPHARRVVGLLLPLACMEGERTKEGVPAGL